MSAKKKTPPATHDDNPEWTEADFAASRPAEELPPEILANSKTSPVGRARKILRSRSSSGSMMTS